ncbi:hypothetical protein O3M35_009035 [Rhynocoris fuscipes]|uniref:Uncharacterized protein n=1 Tax=Rhynocoris fuscipes TaxID=488301 RepID=A0AAW1D2V8_9HEMI
MMTRQKFYNLMGVQGSHVLATSDFFAYTLINVLIVYIIKFLNNVNTHVKIGSACKYNK